MKSILKRPALILPVMAAVLWIGCSGAPEVNNPAPASTSVPQQKPAAIVNNTTASIPVASATEEVSNRVDVVYFHATQRCVTCLCFEEHINTVMETYFQDDIKSGKLTYQVLDVQKPASKDMAMRYGAVGSQLFINVVKGGTDSITDIQEIWYWNCRTDAAGFEQKVKETIEEGLKEIS